MSLLSHPARLSQGDRGSTAFFLVNTCGILAGFPRGLPHASLGDDSLEECAPPVLQGLRGFKDTSHRHQPGAVKVSGSASPPPAGGTSRCSSSSTLKHSLEEIIAKIPLAINVKSRGF